jgi:chemotaxis protein CheD
VADDLGGDHPRRIHYYPKTGRVIRRLLVSSEFDTIARDESDYASRLSARKTAGEIQLFGDD